MATDCLPHHLLCYLCCFLFSAWSLHPILRALGCVQDKIQSLLPGFQAQPQAHPLIWFPAALTPKYKLALATPQVSSHYFPWWAFPVSGFHTCSSILRYCLLSANQGSPFSGFSSSPTSTKNVISPWGQIFHLFCSIMYPHMPDT